MKKNILLVDDDPGIRFGYTKFFTRNGYNLTAVASLGQARSAVAANRFDAALLDMVLPDGNSFDWIEELRRDHPDIALVVITGHGDIPTAVEAIHRGADNFLTKPVSLEELSVILQKSLELGSLRRRQLTTQQLGRNGGAFFGEHPLMQKVMELAALAAENDSPVLLQGETGTGKGVLARWIHDNGVWSSNPYVDINCSSLKGDLFASELFGHARGAFTSANQEKPGLIEVADGGTLFLDEISDMPPGVQAEFLKVIEEKQYRRLGEVLVRRSEFRLICSSNQNLMKKVSEATFRQDLFFRINVFPIQLPPLRARRDDIPALARSILISLGSSTENLSPEAMDLLVAHSWPGNIRELRNVLERAILLSRNGRLTARHLSGLGGGSLPESESQPVGLEEMEKSHISQILDRFNGDTRKAAEVLGISLATLYRKIKKLRIG
ncbi:sigma-54 dependent transcriptional regulator [bacterium]|nr:sigma-54 dependent transcriptional regulator [bacterium]